ncbi:hypothetical protein DNTS_008931, partial [Danionella cerebrum]
EMDTKMDLLREGESHTESDRQWATVTWRPRQDQAEATSNSAVAVNLSGEKPHEAASSHGAPVAPSEIRPFEEVPMDRGVTVWLESASLKESLLTELGHFSLLWCLIYLKLTSFLLDLNPKRRGGGDSAENEVDRNKCCTLCNMFFTSAIVAQSHYQGKTHAKRVRLVLGESQSLPTNTESAPSTPQGTDPPPPPLWQPLTNHSEAGKYCCLCGAWFNNPMMAQQHYEGKKHKRNAARTRLLEQLAGSLDVSESTGLRRSYSCSVCKVVLNSIEQYHAHLQGSKHQNKASPPAIDPLSFLEQDRRFQLIGFLLPV